MNIDNFRLAFPEFANEQTYPDEMVEFWASIADELLNVARWGNLLIQGRYLFVAHNIVLAAQNVIAGDAGKIAGQSGGIISSKGVGGVSISYDTSSFSFTDAGNYNMTSYGRSFWQLMNIVGLGGAQV